MSGENHTDSSLAYGDIILINSPFSDDMMIFTDGVVKSQLYLEYFGTGSRKGSFQRSLFQIYPSFLNTHKNEALNISKGDDAITTNIQRRKERVHDLKEKLTFEYKFNLEHFQKVKQTPVFYGSSIQFLHIASNKLLACHFVEAEVEKENYLLELVDVPCEATNFKIMPSYKHQKENEGYIYYKDLVFIACTSNFVNKVPYLHCNFQDQQPNFDEEESQDQDRSKDFAKSSPAKTHDSVNTQKSIGLTLG